MPDPIGALQNLARQGTGNNQMIGMNGPGPNPQGIVPQSSTNTATNREYYFKWFNLLLSIITDILLTIHEFLFESIHIYRFL